jgi:hypothetical protein
MERGREMLWLQGYEIGLVRLAQLEFNSHSMHVDSDIVVLPMTPKFSAAFDLVVLVLLIPLTLKVLEQVEEAAHLGT